MFVARRDRAALLLGLATLCFKCFKKARLHAYGTLFSGKLASIRYIMLADEKFLKKCCP